MYTVTYHFPFKLCERRENTENHPPASGLGVYCLLMHV